MTDNREILNDAEVDFLLQGADTDPASEAPSLEDGNQTVTMHGDLEQISLADIFQTLGMSKMEGVLRVRNPLEERQIYCADGHVRILVPPRLTLRRLGQRLIQAGMLQPDHLRSALVEQRKVGVPLGELLVRDGLVSQEDLDEILGVQVAEDLFALFTWNHGTFEFFKADGESDELQQQFASCPEYEVNSLLLEVARRSDEWQLILEQVHSLDEIPVQLAEPADPDALDETHHAVLDGVDGKSTYRQLADQTTLGLFEYARAARDLAKGGILGDLDEQDLVDVAAALAEEGENQRAVVLLQTLRERPGDRCADVIRGMAGVLERVGERRFASSLLLEAAQRCTVSDEALELARAARALIPYDTPTLQFLRATLAAHCPPSSSELQKITVDLIDAMIDDDDVDGALALLEEAAATEAPGPQLLTRDARARQKAGDTDGAVQSLLRLAELHLADGAREKAAESFTAVLRLDRSRKDVQRQLTALQRTRTGTLVRAAAALLVLTAIAGMGVAWWQQSALDDALLRARTEVQQLLDAGDRDAARAALGRWSAELGNGPALAELSGKVHAADAAERARLEGLRRAALTERLSEAATRLDRGEVRDAVAIYVEVYGERGMASEVSDVLTKRLRALVSALERATSALDGRLPADPDALLDRSLLATNLAGLQAECPNALLRAHEELTSLCSDGGLPAFLAEGNQQELEDALDGLGPVIQQIRDRAQAYTAALQRDDVERKLDPMFQAAVEKETKFDFAGALELYRELESQPKIASEVRKHFRDRVTRNATIVRLLQELEDAANDGDFKRSRQHLKALNRSFPEVPFAQLVRLPLSVDSLPSRADVRVNGLDVGTTPIVLKRIPDAQTTVTLSIDGFAPLERTFQGEQADGWSAQLTLLPQHVREHGSAVETAPTRLPEGDLVLVDRKGDVTRLDETLRQVRWTFRSNDLSGYLPPGVLARDRLMIASLDGELRALDVQDGRVRWSLSDLPCEVAPALLAGGLALATNDGLLHRVDLSTREQAHVDLGQRTCDDLVRHGDHVVALGERGRVSCWNAALEQQWARELDDLQGGWLRGDGDVLVVGDDQGQLYGLDARSGRQLWRQDLDEAPVGRVAVADGLVWVSTRQELRRFQAATGAALAPFRAPGEGWAGAPHLAGGRVVALRRDGGAQVMHAESGAPLYLLDADSRSRILQTHDLVFVVTPQRELRCHGRLR